MEQDDILFPSTGVFDDVDLSEPSTEDGRKAEGEALAEAYRRLFTGNGSAPDADKVMKDLYRLCWGAMSTWHPDPREHAFREGHRGVLLHILKNAGYNPAGVRRDLT